MPEKVLQMGYMSGDTYTAAVWLKLNSGSKIILLRDGDEPQDKTDKIIAPFYKECGVDGQVVQIDITKKVKAKDAWNALKDNYKNLASTVVLTSPDTKLNTLAEQVRTTAPVGWPRSITAVTGLVANAWEIDSDGVTKTIANMWKVVKVEGELFAALDAYVTSKFTGKTLRDNILVLWSRQSGKRGGAHIELDSSYEGIRQLARYFAINQASATVLLAGDESKSGGKLAGLATESVQIVNISNMWEDSAWTKDPLKSAPYLGQFAFFKHWSRLFNVVHLGMRSGILEAMSLMGMTTFFMEPDVCPSGSRMLAFSRAAVPYTRIQIEAPAGLTAGNAQLAIEGGVAAPTLSGWKERVNRQIEFLMNNNRYLSYYTNKGKVNRDAALRDAVVYAKAKQLREDRLDKSDPNYRQKRNQILNDLLGKSPVQVKNDMARIRGFSREDLNKIVTPVGHAFV